MENEITAIFDLDGTLTDSKPGIVNCLQHALKASGVEWTGSFDWFIGPPVEQSMAKLMPRASEAAREEVVRLYRACYDQTGWSQNSVYTGIPELLSALRELGSRLFVCTSKREVFARRVLADFGLEQSFIAIYADRDDRPHSKVELLGQLIAEQKLDRSSAFMIGDRSYDIEAAHANGIRSIAVTYGYGTREELEACRPTACVDRPAQIVEIVSEPGRPFNTG